MTSFYWKHLYEIEYSTLVVKKGDFLCTFLGEAKPTFIYFSFRVLNLLLYIRVTKFTSRVKTTSHTTNSKMQNMDDYSFVAEGAIMNVQNKDNRCFEYAILCAQHHKKIKTNSEKPSKYKKYLNKLDFTGIEFPVSLNDIDKFEKITQE